MNCAMLSEYSFYRNANLLPCICVFAKKSSLLYSATFLINDPEISHKSLNTRFPLFAGQRQRRTAKLGRL